jgi:haloalkane dehalogenase
VARIEAYDRWLRASTEVPKLLLTFGPGPGAMMHDGIVAWCAANIAGLEIEHSEAVAGHHTPEDQPELIAAAVSAWADRHGLRLR